MKSINEIYKKIAELNNSVKLKLKINGFIVPIQLNDGSIKIDSYIIKKNSRGFFEIKNKKNNFLLENINLAQTAVIITNRLALGKWIDNDLIITDKNYGYAIFEEQVCVKMIKNSLKSKDYVKFDIMSDKIIKARNKKEYYKKLIVNDFQKLLNFR